MSEVILYASPCPAQVMQSVFHSQIKHIHPPYSLQGYLAHEKRLTRTLHSPSLSLPHQTLTPPPSLATGWTSLIRNPSLARVIVEGATLREWIGVALDGRVPDAARGLLLHLLLHLEPAPLSPADGGSRR